MNKKILSLLSTGHLVNDLHQGAIPALVPFLILKHNLSYASAAIIVFAFTGTSTVIQPLFGYLADRFSKSWVIPIGIFLTGAGFALIGIAPNFQMLICTVILSGVGSAVFHPEAAKMVNFSGGEHKATAMSIFGVGGVLGFSIGPFIATGVVLAVGLKGVIVTMVPVLAVALLFFLQSSHLNNLHQNSIAQRKTKSNLNAEDRWLPFSLLSLTIIGESIIYYGLFTFVPLYWTTVLHQSQMAGGTALSLFSGAGVVGSLAGGRLADRFGQRKMIMGGYLLLVPAMPAFLWVDNTMVATILLMIVGMLLLSTYAPTIIMGQKYLPNNIGFSSGMTLGVAFSIGGMVTPALGHLADHNGLEVALTTLAFIPPIIALLAIALPSSIRKQKRQKTEEG